jgi:hypothetical protein
MNSNQADGSVGTVVKEVSIALTGVSANAAVGTMSMAARTFALTGVPGLPEKFDAAASQGLGLKISGVFANQMQGRISIVNTKSVGMLFDLRFPMGCVDN